MSSSSSSAWAVWLVITLLLLSCIGIIIWFAIDNNTPGRPRTEIDRTTRIFSESGTY